MKFLYLTILFFVVWATTYCMLSFIGSLVWDITFHDVVSCEPWIFVGIIISGVIAGFVTDEESVRIDCSPR
jgi:hypothetical protein